MHHKSKSKLRVPEAGSDRVFKRFLLSYEWRKCTDCGIVRKKRNLVTKLSPTTVHWLCTECRCKLIHAEWALENEQGLQAVYGQHVEQALFEALERAMQDTVRGLILHA